MLTTAQSKFTKLAEEASEVGKEALKAVHYGANHDHKGTTTRELLRQEMLDMLIAYRQLVVLGEVDPILEADVQRHFRKKLPKIKRHTKALAMAGRIESNWTPERI